MTVTYIETLFKEVFGDLLIPPRSYRDVGTHAYGYKILIPVMVKRLFNHEQKNRSIMSPETIKEMTENTYRPKVNDFIFKQFHKNHSRYLNKKFYTYLNTQATYLEIKYLGYFLDKTKLPKLQRQKEMNKKDKLEFEFIRNTSTFTRYDKGIRQKRKNKDGQFCEWCGEELKLLEAQMIKADSDYIYVCKKHKKDTIKRNFKRHGFLKPRK